MRGNEARKLDPEDQINENPMEAKIAVIQNDIANIKENVGELQAGMKTANEAISRLQVGQATLQGTMNTLREELNTLRQELNTLRQEFKASIANLESALLKWMVGTAISVASVAFAIAKFVK
jgi:uncharacterized phage infection (PIP) family protein YhgE